MSFYDQKKLQAAHTKVRNNATPRQQALLEVADAAFEAEAQSLDQSYEAETSLRAWAKNLCGVDLIPSEIEELRDLAKEAKSGTSFEFRPKNGDIFTPIVLYKTAFGTVDRLENYVRALEATVIDITSNSQFTALPFYGLMKLAFKRLFNRSK